MTPRPIGDHVREWRQRRRLSQLDLALEAEISTRHLSFIETGRAAPSRDMVLRLAARLDVPLRERNILLVAAGYAPAYPERGLGAPDLGAACAAVDAVLKGHEPYPALAVDRHWTLVAANAAVPLLLAGLPPRLLAPPVNVLRLSLHPDGLAPRLVNWTEWRGHILERLRRQVDHTADPLLADLAAELAAYPAPESRTDRAGSDGRDLAGLVVPLRLATDAGVLTLISTTTLFGTPADITLDELAIESFFPADDATAAILRKAAGL